MIGLYMTIKDSNTELFSLGIFEGARLNLQNQVQRAPLTAAKDTNML